jgi:hypothetical protein
MEQLVPVPNQLRRLRDWLRSSGAQGHLGNPAWDVDGAGVANGCVDGESEQVADAAGVPSGGGGLVEDAVLSERLQRQSGDLAQPEVSALM